VARVEQAVIQVFFVTQKQKTFTVPIDAADRVYAFREIEFGERPVVRHFFRELRQDPVRFMECEKHSSF
jgi:hypothetical protein